MSTPRKRTAPRKRAGIRNLRSNPHLLDCMSDDERRRYAKSLISKTSPRREADLQAATEELLSVLGIWHLHLSCYHATKVIRPGIPDLLIVIDGNAVAIELKTAKGKVSNDQHFEMKRLRDSGAWCYICRSTDDVVAALEDVLGSDILP